MKFYLSSYRLGNNTNQLQKWLSITNKKVAYIPNGLDGLKMNEKRREERIGEDLQDLKDLGCEVELLDLKKYFGNKSALSEEIQSCAMLWLSGGNVFVLRQAMHLSGLDILIQEPPKEASFIYGGYSAAGCVLSPSLEAYQIVDDPTDFPYKMKETIWEGLNLIDLVFLPHHNSNHPESEDIAKELDYCVKNNLPYKTLEDGEVWTFSR